MTPYSKAAAWLPHSKTFGLIRQGEMLLLWTAAAVLPLLPDKFRRTERSPEI